MVGDPSGHPLAQCLMTPGRACLHRSPSSSTNRRRTATAAAAGAAAPVASQPPLPTAEEAATAAAAAAEVAAEQARELAMLLRVKISVASGTGRLDLTDLRLTEIPPSVFEIRDLEELALAGNCLTELPEAIGALTQLKRLGLTGNRLTCVPASIGKLAQLEGLWLHGNLLDSLPPEIGQLAQLQQLSLAGNRLTQLPDVFDDLQKLYEFSASGNDLSSLPPSLGRLGALRKLMLNGNRLQALPDTLGGLTSLVELSLQGNDLRSLPSCLGLLQALKELSVADNALVSLPEEMAVMGALQKVWAYGNRLSHLPASLASAPALASLWLEDNPLQPDCVRHLVQSLPAMASLRHLGLDTRQLAWVDAATVAAAGSQLRVGEVLGSGRGYFKLQRSSATAGSTKELEPLVTPASADAVADPGVGKREDHVLPVADGQTQGRPDERARPPLLVVSFGSAPGLPNWGTLLSRQQREAKHESHRAYDVLFLVDPGRSWYGGGDPAQLAQYTERLRQYTVRYKRVMMLGDSMGATGALLFSPLATSVLAFSPQVDLNTASMRPGQHVDWLLALKGAVLDAVAHSQAEITVLSGTWKHDLDQINMLPQEQVTSKVFSIDSHRLTAYLDSTKRLLPLVEAAILKQLGIPVPSVRLHNLL